MGQSYKENSEEYKNSKKMLIDGYEDAPYKKTKKKKKVKDKRSNHKHQYVPGIYHYIWVNFKGEKQSVTSYGFHCSICGRIQSFYYTWFADMNKIENFKKENPNFVEITLPDSWDIIKDKKIIVK